MRTKGFILTIAIALALICIFYLSFTFVANKYEKIAEQKATEAQKAFEAGKAKKGVAVKRSEAEEAYKNAYNDYISSIEKEKVWLGYTYKEVREKQLGLGLDLKGGMNVTLEIKVPEVLRSLAGINEAKPDPKFEEAIKANKNNEDNKDYVAAFCKSYENNKGSVKKLFGDRVAKIKENPKASTDEIAGYVQEEVNNIIDNSFNVLRTRIDRFGVIAPNIQELSKKGRILLELPGVKDPERVKDLLQKSANLEFYETLPDKEITANALSKSLRELSETYASRTDSKDKTLMSMLGNMRSCAVGRVLPGDTAAVNRIINSEIAEGILPTNLKLCWSVKAEADKDENGNDVGPEKFDLVALKTNEGKAALDGDVVTDASVSFDDVRKQNMVSMSMNKKGREEWSRITADNIGSPVAIVLDDQVYSYPNVQTQISDGRSQITGNFTPEEANDLANVLKSGKIDAKPEIISQHVIGPSLGKESIQKGLTSFIVALILLMIFMVCVYGIKAGSIANLGLLFNLFFTAGILASFQTVLTLPGIAGIVLALGMAVDANVLIFERIKEELRAGKGLKAAVADGYGNAFSAIFDSNLTSIITMMILAMLGSGAIKGFAITTIVGICCSFFTAVYLTRIILEWLIKKNIFGFANITFSTPWTRNLLQNVQFNFLGKRKICGIIVLAIVVVVCFLFYKPGLNMGIDFSGGRNYIVQFDKTVNVEELKKNVQENLPGANTSVITIDNDQKVRISTNYKNDIKDNDNVDKEINDALYKSCKSAFAKPISAADFQISKDMTSEEAESKLGVTDIEHVGPSIASDMRRDASWAVFFALMAMFVYILLRFRNIAFSTGALAAVAFTAFLVIGFYTLHGLLPFSMEIGQTFVAAILTVIGYQVNDTVVVFDRVREYRKLYPKQDLFITFNKALSSTLARTMMTSITTLLVLLVIFFLGGASIRSFVFAMILGVIIGTCSSLFIASPVAYLVTKALEKRRERKKKLAVK